MFKTSLHLRFIIPVSFLVIALVLGGATVFSVSESRRIDSEITALAQQEARNIVELLGVTDALMMQQVRGAMSVLIARGQSIGVAAQGPSVQLKGKSVPDLLFGGKAQANQIDLVDGVAIVVGGTATLFV